jgi:deoxyribodipyrimidine photo-lyase
MRLRCFATAAFSIMSKFSSSASGSPGKSVVWFKLNDLRLQDHAALVQAHTSSTHVDHVVVLDPRQYRRTALGNLKCGPRRFAWTCECLVDLHKSLEAQGSCLHVVVGRAEDALPSVMRTFGATTLFAHSEIAEEEATVQRSVAVAVPRMIEQWGGGTLFSPSELPFDVSKKLSFFTAFRKQVEATGAIAAMHPGPSFPAGCPGGCRPPSGSTLEAGAAVPIADLASSASCEALWARLLDEGSREEEKFLGGVGGCAVAAPSVSSPSISAAASAPGEDLPIPRAADARGAFTMKGGESAAHERISHYITNGVGRLSTYKDTRNGLVGADYSSKLSPYLASGCITARQVLAAVRAFEGSPTGVANDSTYWLIFELLWRDYMRFYALHHGRRLFFLGGPQGAAGRAKWPWDRDPVKFRRWQLGKTGYPIIDAHMRELLLTGFMSNRGRQIVASFLVRDLELDWRLGAEHFESTLVDHDVASNWGNWQYAAGVGADPREDRYFNIVKQGNDYDPQAEHIRLWVPEAKHLPTRVLLDVRQFGEAQRRQFNVGEDVLPLPVCSLWMDRNPKVVPVPVAGGGGGPRMKGASGVGKKGHQHGKVPGRK